MDVWTARSRSTREWNAREIPATWQNEMPESMVRDSSSKRLAFVGSIPFHYTRNATQSIKSVCANALGLCSFLNGPA